MSCTFKNLTKEYQARRGQWIYVAKIGLYDNKGNPVLNIAKFQCFGKKRAFRATFDIGKPFWKDILASNGLIAKAMNEWVVQSRKRREQEDML